MGLQRLPSHEDRIYMRFKELISNIEQMEKKDKIASSHPLKMGWFQREEHMNIRSEVGLDTDLLDYNMPALFGEYCAPL